MADNKLHITPELIRQYLEGKLDDRTMHAIERQALDDPFLAEALEGYAGHPADQQPALADLQSRLEKRVHPPRSGILRKVEFRWLAAASVLLLLCISAVMLMNRSERREMDVAQSNPLKKEDTTVKSPQQQQDTAIPRPMPPVEKPQPEQTPAQTFAQKPQADKEQAPVQKLAQKPAPTLAEEKNEAAAVLAPPPVAQEKAAMARQDSRFLKRKVDTIMIRGTSARDSQHLLAKEREKVEGYIAGEPSKYSNAHTDESHRLISGVVIDEKTGNRLPGVIVSLHGTDRAAVTDTAGGFALQVDKKEKAQLAFSYIGYERKNVTVPENTSRVSVALPVNEAALNDVVVIGYGGKGKKPVVPPAPLIGDEGYQAYLQTKKIVSLEGNIIPVSGEVHISFTVMPDSTLRNFKVLRSLSPEADKAAISIVKEGPKWIPASNKRRATAELKVPIVIKQQP